MLPLKRDTGEIRKLAEKNFLGRLHVIGVGITGKKGDRLVFLLEKASDQSQAEIRSWANSIGVPFDLMVVGKIMPSKMTTQPMRRRL
jgi:hypothetical protein